uniref:Origin recognition complex subunit 2 n=1 Tax=Eptatretus burgeri TaxID=7764 RepID=A0A8C4NFP5_EPTBU
SALLLLLYLYCSCNRLGFNVLLYGLGSKRCLLDDFRLTALHDESHVVLDGSFPNVTLNSVLTLILEEILELPVPHTSVEQLEAVKRSFGTEGACELFLLVHNVDGPTLRASRTQEWFAQLATLPGIHIIATIDHVNAPLVWDQGRAGQFRWLWFDVPTFEAYTEETAYEKSLLVHSSGTLVLSSLRHVLHSLTPNARGIFALLAQYQLKHKDTTFYPGLSFQSCYQQCREAFLVSSDIALRAQLTEFLDHRLVRTKKVSPRRVDVGSFLGSEGGPVRLSCCELNDKFSPSKESPYLVIFHTF